MSFIFCGQEGVDCDGLVTLIKHIWRISQKIYLITLLRLDRYAVFSKTDNQRAWNPMRQASSKFSLINSRCKCLVELIEGLRSVVKVVTTFYRAEYYSHTEIIWIISVLGSRRTATENKLILWQPKLIHKVSLIKVLLKFVKDLSIFQSAVPLFSEKKDF